MMKTMRVQLDSDEKVMAIVSRHPAAPSGMPEPSGKKNKKGTGKDVDTCDFAMAFGSFMDAITPPAQCQSVSETGNIRVSSGNLGPETSE